MPRRKKPMYVENDDDWVMDVNKTLDTTPADPQIYLVFNTEVLNRRGFSEGRIRFFCALFGTHKQAIDEVAWRAQGIDYFIAIPSHGAIARLVALQEDAEALPRKWYAAAAAYMEINRRTEPLLKSAIVLAL